MLIAPAVNRNVRLAIEPGFPLGTALGNGGLAMADPTSVLVGKYGKAALEDLGVWRAVASRIAVAENVRAAQLLGLHAVKHLSGLSTPPMPLSNRVFG